MPTREGLEIEALKRRLAAIEPRLAALEAAAKPKPTPKKEKK